MAFCESEFLTKFSYFDEVFMLNSELQSRANTGQGLEPKLGPVRAHFEMAYFTQTKIIFVVYLIEV